MTKVLNIEFGEDGKCIGEKVCPYCQYNGDYGMSYNSGWDCTHPVFERKRIIDDDHGDVLIPEWCPLPNKVD